MSRFVHLSPNGEFDLKLRDAVAPDILPAGPHELVALLTQEQPEVIIIGPDVAHEDALRFAKIFDVQVPELSLVLVSDVDPAFFLEAMRAGIRDITLLAMYGLACGGLAAFALFWIWRFDATATE